MNSHYKNLLHLRLHLKVFQIFLSKSNYSMDLIKQVCLNASQASKHTPVRNLIHLVNL